MRLLEAVKICSICGELIGRELANFRAIDKNRFLYRACDSCRQKVNERRRKCGLSEKRGADILCLYEKARYLLDQGNRSIELKNYLELMNYLLTCALTEKKTLEEYQSQLEDLGELENLVSKGLTDVSIPITLGYIESAKSSPFFGKIDRAQQNRRRKARESYAKRIRGEMPDKPHDLLLFDVLFDPF